MTPWEYSDNRYAGTCIVCGDEFVKNSANHVRCATCKRRGYKVPTHQELAYQRLDKFLTKLQNIKGSSRGQRNFKVPELQKIIEIIMYGEDNEN